MSRALPMDDYTRTGIYYRQGGLTETAAQRRRRRHKNNRLVAMSLRRGD